MYLLTMSIITGEQNKKETSTFFNWSDASYQLSIYNYSNKNSKMLKHCFINAIHIEILYNNIQQ